MTTLADRIDAASYLFFPEALAAGQVGTPLADVHIACRGIPPL